MLPWQILDGTAARRRSFTSTATPSGSQPARRPRPLPGRWRCCDRRSDRRRSAQWLHLLVGAALATFDVVLLALSEQIGFGPAYALAAAAGVGGWAVLRARRAGLLLGGVLGMIDTMLYGLIAAEQYALLIGALVLLGMVALKYLTRRIDWYARAQPSASPHRNAIMERS